MSDQSNQERDIERDEAWLAEFWNSISTPTPDRAVLERVKFRTRLACEGEVAAVDPLLVSALDRAKTAVRQELDASAVAEGVRGFRPWAPVFVAAAALAFAFVGMQTAPASGHRLPPLDVFLSSLEREPDEMDTTLMALASDMSVLEVGYNDLGVFSAIEAWSERMDPEFTTTDEVAGSGTS
jgi:hypothetical protein